MKKVNYRHGDVLIIAVNEIPDKAIKQNDLTLARGEQTGHHHTIVEGMGERLIFNDEMYLRIQSDIAKIDHPEHGLKTLIKGNYKIKIRRQWQEDGWYKVID